MEDAKRQNTGPDRPAGAEEMLPRQLALLERSAPSTAGTGKEAATPP